MRQSLDWLRQLHAQAWQRPDELMLQFGAGGELLVARVRALLSALILLLPVMNALAGGTTQELLVGLAGALLANVMAQTWLALARRRRVYPWLPYATGTYDVTSTTLVLLLLALGDRAAGLNSVVVWSFYLLSIAMTALRNDGRLTLYVGALAMLQFGALALGVLASAATPEQLMSADYGTASISNVVQRLVVLLMMTLLTSAVVFRMQRLIELSGNDGLTGLPNRSWLLQRMPALFDALRREQGSLTVALLDIDHFRRINEEAGHLDGDRAIRHVAAFLQEALQGDERLVRLGGQEFVLLLRSPLGAAWERTERSRRAMAALPFASARGERYALTFSAGLASWPQDGTDTATLLKAADRRLQAAKLAGRNRVLARDP